MAEIIWLAKQFRESIQLKQQPGKGEKKKKKKKKKNRRSIIIGLD